MYPYFLKQTQSSFGDPVLVFQTQFLFRNGCPLSKTGDNLYLETHQMFRDAISFYRMYPHF